MLVIGDVKTSSLLTQNKVGGIIDEIFDESVCFSCSLMCFWLMTRSISLHSLLTVMMCTSVIPGSRRMAS